MGQKLTQKQQQIAADARRPYADKIRHLTHEADCLLTALRTLASQIPLANHPDTLRALASYAKDIADNYRP